eukprot:GEMP01084582.1.p1 GENE.GEMP01084582.1~~GEMP01084582.1.p1  ORF type:complete len:100 (-),score=2.55 GEMP01084582.1:2-301(-)
MHQGKKRHTHAHCVRRAWTSRLFPRDRSIHIDIGHGGTASLVQIEPNNDAEDILLVISKLLMCGFKLQQRIDTEYIYFHLSNGGYSTFSQFLYRSKHYS